MINNNKCVFWAFYMSFKYRITLGAYSFKRVEGWGLIRGFFQNFNFVGCLQMECKALPLSTSKTLFYC